MPILWHFLFRLFYKSLLSIYLSNHEELCEALLVQNNLRRVPVVAFF